MKKLLKILGVILLLIVLLVLYIMSTTGFFRSISNSYDGKVEKIVVPGAEDFAISRSDSFLIISSTDRAGFRDGDALPSGLYLMDLRSDDRSLKKLTDDKMPMNPHGISMIKVDSNTHRILAISHVPKDGNSMSIVGTDLVHSIEEYLLREGNLRHIKTYKHDMVYHPNDVVAIDDTRFYFTNDHGARTKLGLLGEDYLGIGQSDVIYYDGKDYKRVADGIAYANGIMNDPDRGLLYVASPRHFLTKVYRIEKDMSLTHIEDIDCGTGVDNIELDNNGKIWIGCHPSLLHFDAYAKGNAEYAPGEVITIDYRGKGDYDVESVYTEDGKTMSAPTTAIPFGDDVYVGNVMDQYFIILEKAKLN